jgi:hypothetical protein
MKPIKMTKTDLMLGNVVQLRNGKLALLTMNDLSTECFLTNLVSGLTITILGAYTLDMKHKSDSSLDIKIVYKDYWCDEQLWRRANDN